MHTWVYKRDMGEICRVGNIKSGVDVHGRAQERDQAQCSPRQLHVGRGTAKTERSQETGPFILIS
jgi:hypothetical protein